MGELTIGLLAGGSSALANLALLLQVNVPAFLLAFAVLKGKGEDSTSALHSLFSVGLATSESRAYHVEGL